MRILLRKKYPLLPDVAIHGIARAVLHEVRANGSFSQFWDLDHVHPHIMEAAIRGARLNSNQAQAVRSYFSSVIPRIRLKEETMGPMTANQLAPDLALMDPHINLGKQVSAGKIKKFWENYSAIGADAKKRVMESISSRATGG